MEDICGDNRFEIIKKAKAELLKSTNIEISEDEMKVLDRFLFRCRQMDRLERYEKTREPLDIPTMTKDLLEFVELVKMMREAQAKHEIANMKLKYHQQADREIPDEVWNEFACTMDWMVECEDKVDEYLKKMEE